MFSAQQARLQFRFARNKPLEFTFAIEQSRVNPATNFRAGLVKHFQQRTRPASFTCEQRGSGEAFMRTVRMQAHQDLNVQLLDISN